jgi:predicted MFS family arabinose efflux permease
VADDKRGFGVKIGILSICWAFTGMGNLLLVSVVVLAGYMVAENKALAALPVALQWLGTAMMAAPASFYMRRFGRRIGFWTANAIISSGAGLAVWAIYSSNFALLCGGVALVGIGNGFIWYYRFAAAEIAPERFRAHAISLLLAGGVLSAVIGPSLADWTKEALAPVSFAGSFAMIIVLNAVVAMLLLAVKMPRPQVTALKGGRPMGQIAKQPEFIVAVIGGLVAYGVMVLLMSVTPLAMKLYGHDFAQATLVIQWHVLGMYVPSFFTGSLVKRMGMLRVMLLGAILIVVCVIVGLNGTSVEHFWLALACLGLGWNFLFVGSTALLTGTYTIAERAKTQAFNETAIFTTVGIATFFSGTLLLQVGWRAVNYAALPPVGLVIISILWLMYRNARRKAVVQPAAGE